MRDLRRRRGAAAVSSGSRACPRPAIRGLRTMMIQLGWLWLRHQPQSALALWFKAQSQRGRKRTIVALARKLLVALWKYVTQGVVIEGAVMKSS
jgi:hypothetical protein